MMINDKITNWQETLKSKFHDVLRAPLTEQEFDALIEARSALFDPPRDSWTYEQMLPYWEINEKLGHSAIRVETLPEFRYLLELFGLAGDELTDIIAPENTRANLSEQFGEVCLGYILYIHKGIREGREAYMLVAETDFQTPIMVNAKDYPL